MNTAKNDPGVWPCLFFHDPETARRFLVEALGFTETLTVRSDDQARIVHAEMTWPEGGGVMYGSAGAPGEKPAGAQWLYVVTDDPDAVYRRASRAGATVVQEPYDADYGSTNVAIADPEGNIWTFGTYHGSG